MTEITEKLKKATFNNDIDVIEKLYLMSKGDKTSAYKMIRRNASRHGMTDLTDLEIDTAIAEINDGIAMEWAT